MKRLGKVKSIVFLFVSFSLFLFRCGNSSKINISYSVQKGVPIITIDDPCLKEPLRIVGTSNGLFYFEGEEGRFWVDEEPDNIVDTPGQFVAEWNIYDKNVQLHLQYKKGIIESFGGHQLTVSFEANQENDILGWGFSFDAISDEFFTGLFERTVDGDQRKSWQKGITAAMNLRGQTVDMIIKPSLSLYCPFYISSRGYGLFVEGTWPGHYDFCNQDSNKVQIFFEGSELHAILYTAPELAPIVRAHSLNVGPTIVPPKWAFRPWRWRDNHSNLEKYFDGTQVEASYNSMVVEDILMMEALDIPCGAYWVDRPWAVGPYGYSDFKWDPKRFPNVNEMIDWLHNKNIKFMLWIAPWIMGNMADTAIQNEYFLPSKKMASWDIKEAKQIHDFNHLLTNVKPKLVAWVDCLNSRGLNSAMKGLGYENFDENDTEAVKMARGKIKELIESANSAKEIRSLVKKLSPRILIDFTNPDACKWWQENGLRKVLEDGVDGFKLDRSEEIVPETRDVRVFDGRTARENRTNYPVQYVRTTYGICKKFHNDNFMLFPRAGYTGSSRYSGFWGGDIGSLPEGLRCAIIAVQRSAIMGYPIWGSDIGGYWQGDLDREVCARWLAFGAFCPLMEVGPTEDRGFWDMKKEPHYDAELIAVWRLYAKLHDQLVDYSYKHAEIAQETGLPIVRPLFLIYPVQEEAWKDWQTFLYGQDILVSPICQKGVTTHPLYLPAGERWIDAWNPEKVYQGGKWISIEVPVYKIPIFIRKGANFDLGNLEALYNESLSIARQKIDIKVLENKEFRNVETDSGDG